VSLCLCGYCSLSFDREGKNCQIVFKVSTVKFGHRAEQSLGHFDRFAVAKSESKIDQSAFPKLLAGFVTAFGNPIRVHHETIVKVKGDLLLGILPIFEDTKDAAAAIEGLGESIAPEQNRRIVTCVAVR